MASNWESSSMDQTSLWRRCGLDDDAIIDLEIAQGGGRAGDGWSWRYTKAKGEEARGEYW